VTRDQAAAELAAAGYDSAATAALLDEAARFPGRWAYPPDRRRTVVHHMPAGVWDVRDCAESEAAIRAIGSRR
jgi:hypothetical protein